jgi:hypothetical protein
VAAYDDGHFLVVWQSYDQDGSDFGIFARRFTSAGEPLATELQVNTYTTSFQRDPSVAAAADGGFVVAWTSYGQDGSGFGVFARPFSSSGGPLATELQVNTFATSFQRDPSVAAATGGDFVVVWRSQGQDGSDSGVFARRFSASGAPLTGELQVNTYITGNQFGASVASDDDGDFVVVWSSSGQDGSSFGVFARRFSNPGDPLTDELPVNTHIADAQSYPSVAADDDGDFLVVWHSNGQDGSSYGIFSRRFSSAGVPLANELQINTYGTSAQTFPSVAADSAGASSSRG